MKGRSCLTNFLEFFEKVTKEVDEGKAVDVVYMDFSKRLIRFPMVSCCRKYGRMGLRVTEWFGSGIG